MNEQKWGIAIILNAAVEFRIIKIRCLWRGILPEWWSDHFE
jgi:hypothetical protein